MSVSLCHSPPTASVKHLIRHFEPGCPSHPQKGLPPAKWMDVPFDIMREVSHAPCAAAEGLIPASGALQGLRPLLAVLTAYNAVC